MSDLSAALESTRHRPVRYAARRQIYDEDQVADGLFRVDRGCVRLQVIGETGERQILTFLFPGDFFGFSFDRRASAAEAVTDVELTHYPLGAMIEHPRWSEVLFKVVATVTSAYSDLAHHLEQVTHLSARERVTHFLSWLAQREEISPDGEIYLPMTRRDICDYLALSRETLSRTLRELADSRTIRFQSPHSFTFVRTRRSARAPQTMAWPSHGS